MSLFSRTRVAASFIEKTPVESSGFFEGKDIEWGLTFSRNECNTSKKETRSVGRAFDTMTTRGFNRFFSETKLPSA